MVFFSCDSVPESVPRLLTKSVYQITNNTGYDFTLKAFYDSSNTRREGRFIDSLFVKNGSIERLTISVKSNQKTFQNTPFTSTRNWGQFERLELHFANGKVTHYNYRPYWGDARDSVYFADTASSASENPFLAFSNGKRVVENDYYLHKWEFRPISFERAR